jgi:hypothetical protein
MIRVIRRIVYAFMPFFRKNNQSHDDLQEFLCTQFQIPGTRNYDTHPSLRKLETYPKFQTDFVDYKAQLEEDFKGNLAYTSYKFGDGDYYFLRGLSVGSAAPGKRALSRKLTEQEMLPFLQGASLCDKYFCEIYPENRQNFKEIIGDKSVVIPAEFNYGLIANKWIFNQFGSSIGIIGAGEKIELIELLMKNEHYQEYLGLEKFTDYISVPQKFACDNLEFLENSLNNQLSESSAKLFLFGIGHVKSGMAHRLTRMKSAIYIDVGSGIDAIAGIIDAKRPYFGGWVNHQIRGSFDYSRLDLLQLEESKEILDETRHLIATQLQVAMINKMLPKGFKFESLETVKRQIQIEQSKQLAKLPVNKRRKVFLELIINTLDLGRQRGQEKGH